jgi:hypothetical protein
LTGADDHSLDVLVHGYEAMRHARRAASNEMSNSGGPRDGYFCVGEAYFMPCS